MPDLSTRYLGLNLKGPLVPSASPLCRDLSKLRQMEDSGASAVVLHSLFEEQIDAEENAWHSAVEGPADTFAEATSYFPRADEYQLGPDKYLEQVRRIREAVKVPVIASLNGTTAAGWLRYARLLVEAGAQALELNVYYVATNPDETSDAVEQRVVDVLTNVKQAVSVPVAVKLSPFYSSFARLARRLDDAGADGLVVFNRFYQPDIDVEQLEVVPKLALSSPHELLPRLRWLAILSGRVRASLAVTGGVHDAQGALKAVMAGAHAVQMVSALLREGPEVLRRVRDALEQWLVEHEYESLRQAQGSMSLERCPDPSAFERGNYMRVLQSWRGLV